MFDVRSPSPLTLFVVKAIGVYALWFVVYDLWLLPDGRLDAWLSGRVAAWAGGMLTLLGQAPEVIGRVVRLPGTGGVIVENGCNGLSALGLFIGFVVAYPGDAWRRVWFILAGILSVLLVNVLRVAVLALVHRYAPEWFGLAHVGGAQTIFYVLVFVLWMVWARIGQSVPVSAPPSALVGAS